MEELIRGWDGERIVIRYDHEADAWMIVAIHSTRLGPAVGGTRMKVYDAPRDGLRDVQRLAAGMTYKWAGVDFPLGGGKGVIALSRPVEGVAHERLLERYGELVESLRGGFYTGADLGVGPESMEVIGRKTRRARGLTAGDPGPWTALGVFVSMEAVAQELFGRPELKGRTVLVQGVGDAGLPLCKLLRGVAADLRIADIDAARARAVAEELGAAVVDPGKVYDEPCDIFAPCAVGAVLNAETIPRLRCRAVVGSANNQLEVPEDAERLQERGILYAPDFICNAGGAIFLTAVEMLEMGEDAAAERVRAIRGTLEELLHEAKQRRESPARAADRRVQRVLERGSA
jgi:leucine dehydrogenase